MKKTQLNQCVSHHAPLIENQLAFRADREMNPTPLRLSAILRRAAAWGGRVRAALCPPVSPTPAYLSGKGKTDG